MAFKYNIVFGILLLQLYVSAAPSDISTLGDIADAHEMNIKLGCEPNEFAKEDTTDNISTESARQKRFFNDYGYGFPPINPLIYPSNIKTGQSSDTAIYGTEDPFVQIYKRLQEIADFARQPPPLQPPSQIPIFFPVIYIPQIGCHCAPESNTSNIVPQNPPADKNDTLPDIDNRTPAMEDDRQNWGFVVNKNDTYDDNDEDFVRPISFDPITPKMPLQRPAPPVEHGSDQEDSQSSTEATEKPVVPLAPESSLNELSNESQQPSNCDGAVLSCCHQLQVTYNCFVSRGCPDPTPYGNPCDSSVVLQVIDRFQKYYGQRN